MYQPFDEWAAKELKKDKKNEKKDFDKSNFDPEPRAR